MRFSDRDSLCNVPPLFHCFDKCKPSRLDIHVAADIKTGSPIVARGDAFSPPPPSSPLPSPFALLSFSPKDIVQAVSYERCTAIHGVPTHFIGVLDELDRVGSGVDMSSLR
ncbi:hypothetical protein AG1IA_06822 [Rhizoctonia solani AG-1 IA]|nr:hypothetical protein AG1IA_06822 [Rhizoctonia solani AG-1 IA]